MDCEYERSLHILTKKKEILQIEALTQDIYLGLMGHTVY